MKAGPGSRGLRALGVLSIALLLVAAVFWASQDLRDSVAATVQLVRPEVERPDVSAIPVTQAAKAAGVAEKVVVKQAAVVTQQQAAAAVRVITTVRDRNNKTIDILDEPLPENCYAEDHADYDGYAVQWGLGNKARSAKECCQMCKDFKPRPDMPNGCNIWVWCGDPSGVCWTMDIHEHTTGDCWLKYQAGWDNNPDRSTTNLKVNHRGRFTPEFRAEHKTAPEFIPWVAGVIPQRSQAP